MTKSLSPLQFFLSASPLFLVLFIDGMGMGLLFPVLSSIIIDPANSILPMNTSVQTRNFIYGAIMSIFMFCWFFGAAFLGDLSDKIGRKKALMICLIGVFIGYILSAIAIFYASLTMLIIGRVIAGFTSGSQAIAQAAIVDISAPEQKTRNIGLILLAVSLGFIFGPLFGGFFADSHLVSWFNFSTPLYFAALISFINAILLMALFHETFHESESIQIKWHRAIEIFISAFKQHKIRDLSIILLFMIIGWSNYFAFISVYLLRQYAFTASNLAIFMSLLAIGFGIGCGYLTNYCSRHFSLQKTVAVTAALTAVGVVMTIAIPSVYAAWIAVVPIGVLMAVAYSVIVSIFSNQVDEESQGWVMGITGAIAAFAFGAANLVSAVLVNLSDSLPLMIAALTLGISALLMALHRPL